MGLFDKAKEAMNLAVEEGKKAAQASIEQGKKNLSQSIDDLQDNIKNKSMDFQKSITSPNEKRKIIDAEESSHEKDESSEPAVQTMSLKEKREFQQEQYKLAAEKAKENIKKRQNEIAENTRKQQEAVVAQRARNKQLKIERQAELEQNKKSAAERKEELAAYKESLPEIDKKRIVGKVPVHFTSKFDRDRLGGETIYPKMYQLDDNSIVFNLKHAIQFQIDSIEYDGPSYHEEVETTSNGTTKKNRHGLAGAVTGGILTGGVGAIAGGVVGHGMGKDKTSSTSVSKTTQVEDYAGMDVNFTKLDDGSKLKVQFAITSDEYDNFRRKIVVPDPNTHTEDQDKPAESESLVDQLRSLKTLVDDGILTQEEFEAKKKQILGI